MPRLTRKTRIVIVIAVVACAALLAWAFAPRPVLVEAAAATRGRFELAIEEDGRTRVRDRYTVSAPLAGRLSRIALREGDGVARGAVVATLTPTLSPMLDARSERQLVARADAAEAVVARARTRIERARVGLAQARHVLRRDEALAKDKFISAGQLDNDRLAVSAAQKELDGAIEDAHVAGHELEQARAALAAIRGDAEAAAFEIRAPVAGRVLRLLQPSETVVAVGTALIEIGDIGKMDIVTELLTADALQAEPGTPVLIERWGGRETLDGRVRRVEPAGFTKISALGVEEQRVNVLIDITSPPERWKALGDGYRVGVRILALVRDDVLRVPTGAVFPRAGSAGGAMAVFVVDNGRARLRPVEVGARNGETAWIVSGLKAGERVIVYPGEAIREGARVRERTIDPVTANAR